MSFRSTANCHEQTTLISIPNKKLLRNSSTQKSDLEVEGEPPASGHLGNDKQNGELG